MRGCTNRLDWKFLCQRLLTANRQCTSTSLTSQPPGRNIIIRSLSKLVPNYLYRQFYLLYKSNTRQIVRWLHGSEASLRLRRVCAECVKYFNQDPDLYCIVKVIGYLTTILIAIYTTISNINAFISLDIRTMVPQAFSKGHRHAVLTPVLYSADARKIGSKVAVRVELRRSSHPRGPHNHAHAASPLCLQPSVHI